MTIYFKKLDHVQLCIPIGAEAKAKTFYTGVLGLEELEKPNALKSNGGIWYKISDIELHLGVEKMREEIKSKRHPAFEVANVSEVRSYLEQNGIKTKNDIPIPGVERFSFYDPFGNRIELLEKDRS
jgi:catechol 2,3-dioxygenase-like lactoylglutathione lyase family enzyme